MLWYSAGINRAIREEQTGAVGPIPESPFLAHTREAGVSTCSKVYPALGQLLTFGAQYDVHSEWNKEDPDRHPMQGLVGLNYTTPSYNGVAAGLVFATPTGASCEGVMVRIAPFARKCTDVSKTLPSGSSLGMTLSQINVYNLANNGGQALLLPFGESCIAISVTRAAG